MMWLRLPKSREASKGTRAAPPVLCVLYTTHPALTRWAKVCRAYGAGRNANSPFSSHPSAYALG